MAGTAHAFAFLCKVDTGAAEAPGPGHVAFGWRHQRYEIMQGMRALGHAQKLGAPHVQLRGTGWTT